MIPKCAWLVLSSTLVPDPMEGIMREKGPWESGEHLHQPQGLYIFLTYWVYCYSVLFFFSKKSQKSDCWLSEFSNVYPKKVYRSMKTKQNRTLSQIRSLDHPFEFSAIRKSYRYVVFSLLSNILYVYLAIRSQIDWCTWYWLEYQRNIECFIFEVCIIVCNNLLHFLPNKIILHSVV